MQPINAQDYVLALLEEHATDIALNLGEEDKIQVKFNNDKISTTQHWNDISLDLFAAKGTRTISTTINSFERSKIDLQVKKIIKMLNMAPENPEFLGMAHGPFHYPKVNIYDKKLEDKEKIMKFVETGLTVAEKEGTKDTAGVLEFSTSDSRLLTSHGVDIEAKASLAYYSIRTFATENASGYGNAVSTHLNQLNIKQIAKEASLLAIKAKNPSTIDPGVYNVLFYPYPFSNLAEQIGDSCSIDSVETGQSCFENMLGKQVGSHAFSLTDDHTIPHGIGSEPCDDEGYPSQTTPLIDKGTLKTYLHNTSTAKKYKTKSTGNAGILFPSPSNLVVHPGKISQKEILNSFSGIIVTNTWYTRFQNHTTGDFSTIPRDAMFLVKDGKIIKPIKGIRITDSIPNICRNITQLSDKSIQQYGWEVETPVFSPFVVVRDVTITKSTD